MDGAEEDVWMTKGLQNQVGLICGLTASAKKFAGPNSIGCAKIAVLKANAANSPEIAYLPPSSIFAQLFKNL